MNVLVLDNYGSFTYNLVQIQGELGTDPVVINRGCDVNRQPIDPRLR